MNIEATLSNEEREVHTSTSNYSAEGKVSRINMAECFSSSLEKTSKAKHALEEMVDMKQMKKERKPRLRLLTDATLEKYRLLSEGSDMGEKTVRGGGF